MQKLEFDDNYFDLVISVNTVHNLDIDDCKKSIQEISRVSKKNSFLTVDAFNNGRKKKNVYVEFNRKNNNVCSRMEKNV